MKMTGGSEICIYIYKYLSVGCLIQDFKSTSKYQSIHQISIRYLFKLIFKSIKHFQPNNNKNST